MTSRFGVLSSGMMLVVLLNTAVGFSSYAKFGNKLEGSVTLNLPQDGIFIAIKLIFALTSFFNFVIQQYVIVDRLWPIIESYLKSKNYLENVIYFFELFFRALIVGISCN